MKEHRTPLDWFWVVLATVGFVGWIPWRVVKFKKMKGSGLLGTLVGWGVLWKMPESGVWFWGALIGGVVLAVWASHEAEKTLTYDDPRIVIDEVVGVWVACIALPRTWGPMVAGLILFRLFDVMKGPWGRAVSRWPGGVGIVADDLLAGGIANALVWVGMILS